MNNEKVLDLGCGKNKHVGAIGVDNVKLDGVDIVWDLNNFPYPFEIDSIDKIYCSHIIEHFDIDSRNKLITEICRILKPGGTCEIRVPHAYSIGAQMDPTHKSFYLFNTIKYFTKGFHYYNSISNQFILTKIWANFAFYNSVRYSSPLDPAPQGKFQKLFSAFFTNIFKKVFNFSSLASDFAVRFIPAACVEIVWFLEKE